MKVIFLSQRLSISGPICAVPWDDKSWRPIHGSRLTRARTQNAAELIKIIEDWLQAQDSDPAALKRLDQNRVPNAPVLSVEQAVDHPQLRERRTVRKIHDRVLGDFLVPGFPLRFSDFPGELTLEAPFLGEHNAEVLETYLGYSSSHVRELESAGVLFHADR
jgi:crotonobetainyl-CoA:carnitine CoA-transferase CaiB-like acyl-CoA transferase